MTACRCKICRHHDAEMTRCRANIPYSGPTITDEQYAAWDAAADRQLQRILANPKVAHHDHRIPLETIRQVWKRDNGRCQGCGEHRDLELHHLRYSVEMNAWHLSSPSGRRHYAATYGDGSIFGHETPDDLDLLCRYCHHRRHIDPNGEYWSDPQEMQEYWDDPYYWEMAKD